MGARRAAGARPAFFLRHAGRRRAHRTRRAALPRQLPGRHRRDCVARAGRPCGRTERRHLDQAQRAASALRGAATRAGAGRTGPQRVDPVRSGSARQHRAHHRRRGSGPAGAVAGSLRVTCRAGGARASALARLRAGAANLSDPFAGTGGARGRTGAPPAPALHVPAGKGRVLGRRDQARAGTRAAAVSGVHPQAPHRHLLSGVRTGVAGRQRRHLSAVRHPQRRHRGGHPADGAGHAGRVRVPAAARHG